MRLFLVLLFLCTACFANNAQAQSKKELAAQDAALAERVARLESSLLTGDPAADRLMRRIDALEAEQRTLTGEVERLRYERDNLRAELKAISDGMASLEELAGRTRMHLDAVDLIAQEKAQAQVPYSPGVSTYGQTSISTTPGASSPALAGQSERFPDVQAGQVSSVPSAPVLKEVMIPVQEEYSQLKNLPESGKNKLLMGDYSGAQIDFQTYLAALPDADDADEMNYWLGETYFVKGAYADAATAYIASMRKDAQGTKAPEAMIKLGSSLRELGKKEEACQTFDSFPAQYPNVPASIREKVRAEIARTSC